MVPEEVNGEKSSMELFIGASISIISKEAWRRQLPKVPLEESQIPRERTKPNWKELAKEH